MLVACDANRITSAEQLDIVAAFRDTAVDFGAIATYAMPDSVVHLTADPENEPPAGVTRRFDELILARVQANLDERGYVRELDPAVNEPDVTVLVGAIATTRFISWVSYPWFAWWGFYPAFESGPFDPSWGIAYPWAGVITAFEYDTGTIVIEMLDARDIDPDDPRLNALWGSAMNGILSGSDEAIAARVTASIDEAFALSPYLRRAP